MTQLEEEAIAAPGGRDLLEGWGPHTKAGINEQHAAVHAHRKALFACQSAIWLGDSKLVFLRQESLDLFSNTCITCLQLHSQAESDRSAQTDLWLIIFWWMPVILLPLVPDVAIVIAMLRKGPELPALQTQSQKETLGSLERFKVIASSTALPRSSEQSKCSAAQRLSSPSVTGDYRMFPHWSKKCCRWK